MWSKNAYQELGARPTLPKMQWHLVQQELLSIWALAIGKSRGIEIPLPENTESGKILVNPGPGLKNAKPVMINRGPAIIPFCYCARILY